MKQAWSHMVSGTVSDMVNSDLIQITTLFPDCHLVLNAHDGLTLSFPVTRDPEAVCVAAWAVTERAWEVGGFQLAVPCSWDFLHADGTVTHPQGLKG